MDLKKGVWMRFECFCDDCQMRVAVARAKERGVQRYNKLTEEGGVGEFMAFREHIDIRKGQDLLQGYRATLGNKGTISKSEKTANLSVMTTCCNTFAFILPDGGAFMSFSGGRDCERFKGDLNLIPESYGAINCKACDFTDVPRPRKGAGGLPAGVVCRLASSFACKGCHPGKGNNPVFLYRNPAGAKEWNCKPIVYYTRQEMPAKLGLHNFPDAQPKVLLGSMSKGLLGSREFAFHDGDGVTTRFYIDNRQLFKQIEDGPSQLLTHVDMKSCPKGQQQSLMTMAHQCGLKISDNTNGETAASNSRKRGAVSLGVIRLDYDYPPSPGDIDHPGSFDYDVLYRVVPGLTFEMCQQGKLTPAIEDKFKEAVDWLEMKGVTGITGDCGFMMYFQKLARLHTHKPVFMSALAQLPAVTCAFNKDELIAVLTANGKSLHPMRSLIKDECAVDPDEERFIFVGCEDVPGFEAVALGEKVDVKEVTPGIVAKAKAVLAQHPRIRAFLFECTELPPYSDAVRAATGLPVYDAITCCDLFISGNKDNHRFGVNNWMEQWDGKQEDYVFGANLGTEDQKMLVNKPKEIPVRSPGQGNAKE
jgi:hypothetical protein